MTYRGTCFCGGVEITVTGAPAAMGYCHCSSCRLWSASPLNAFTLWPLDAVKIVKGAQLVGEYHKTERSHRQWCKRCGGHVMTEHPQWKLIDVYSAVIPDFPFKPGVHVNYAESVLPVKDGLPKLKDLPKEMGGTGEAIPE
ncbi:MAG: GFA family protein [Polyangia bacterium]